MDEHAQIAPCAGLVRQRGRDLSRIDYHNHTGRLCRKKKKSCILDWPKTEMQGGEEKKKKTKRYVCMKCTHADERKLGTKRHLGFVSGDSRRKPPKSAVTSFGEKDVLSFAAAARGVASERAAAVLSARLFWDFCGDSSSSSSPTSPTSPLEPPNSKNKLSLLRESAERMACSGASSSSSSSSSPSELRHGIFSSAGNSRIVRGDPSAVEGSAVVLLVGLRPLLMRWRCFKSGADGQTKGAQCRLFAGRSGVRLRIFEAASELR